MELHSTWKTWTLHQDLPIMNLIKKNILKDNLDSIPSPLPSVKIQIMGSKVCLRCKGKTLVGIVKNFDIIQQCFALLPQVNFPTNSLNFHWGWRWWDRIQPIFLNLFYFTNIFFFFRLWIIKALDGFFDQIFKCWSWYFLNSWKIPRCTVDVTL